MATNNYERLSGEVDLLSAKLNGFMDEVREIQARSVAKPKTLQPVVTKDRLVRAGVASLAYGVGSGLAHATRLAISRATGRELARTNPRLAKAVPVALGVLAGAGSLMSRPIQERIDHYIDTGDKEQFKFPKRRRPGYFMDPNYKKPSARGTIDTRT